MLGDKLPADQAEAGAQQIVAVMQKMNHLDQLRSLGEALAHIQTVKIFDYPAIVELLKHVLIVGEIRRSILNYVSRDTGQKFDGLQAFVDWAKEENKNLDWESPPRNPLQ